MLLCEMSLFCVWGRLNEGRVIVLRIVSENVWRVHCVDHTHHTHAHTDQAELQILSSCFMKPWTIFILNPPQDWESPSTDQYTVPNCYTQTNTHKPASTQRARARFRKWWVLCWKLCRLWYELSQAQRRVEEERAEKLYSCWEISACSFCSY